MFGEADRAQGETRNSPIPMIILILVTYLIVAAAGSGILIHGVIHDPIGFEDETGYHPLCASTEWEMALASVGSQRQDPVLLENA